MVLRSLAAASLTLPILIAACGGSSPATDEKKSTTDAARSEGGTHADAARSEGGPDRDAARSEGGTHHPEGGPLDGSMLDAPIGGTCPFASPVPFAPPPVAAGASQQEMAEQQGMVILDTLFGQFLRGDVLVYRGTAQATAVNAVESLTLGDPTSTTVVLPEGPVLASLAVGPPNAWDWGSAAADGGTETAAILVVYALPANEYLPFGELGSQASTLWSGSIGADDVAMGVSTDAFDRSCTSCGPDLLARPSTITMNGVETSAVATVFEGIVNMGGENEMVAVNLTTTASLTQVEPCTLEWTDLQRLNTATGPNDFSQDIGLQDFKPSGGDLVWTYDGSFAGPSPDGGCPTYTSYSIDLYINPANLADYGVRNYQVGSSRQECPA